MCEILRQALTPGQQVEENAADSSCILQTSADSGVIGNNLVRAVNAVLLPVQAQLNEQLPTEIQERGYDPMEQVASGTVAHGPTINIPLSPCSVKTSITYDIYNLLGLDSIWISELLATQASTKGVSASATGSFKVQFNQSLTAEGKLKVSLSFGFQGKVKTLSKALVSARVSDVQFQVKSFIVSCSEGEDNICETITATASIIFRKSLEAQISMSIQDTINEKLESLAGKSV
ncbi:unnamed protein product, partial [Polarella glacialis]